jgi:hypothetical protein
MMTLTKECIRLRSCSMVALLHMIARCVTPPSTESSRCCMVVLGYAKLEHAHKYVYTLTSSSTINSMNIERKMSIVQKLLSRRSQNSVADTQNGDCDRHNIAFSYCPVES